jgi:hypothetical protein
MTPRRLFPEPLPLAWVAQGDEWLHNLQQILTDRESATGLQINREPQTESLSGQVVRIRANGDSLAGELQLFPDAPGGADVVLAAGSNDEKADLDAEKWRAAILQSVERLGAVNNFRWWGVIDLAGPSVSGNALATAATVGGLTVHRSGKPFTDLLCRGESPSLNQLSFSTSFPSVVHGEVAGFNWQIASSVAHRRLTRLCAVLTLAVGEGWLVKSVPSPIGAEEIEIPDSPYPDSRAVIEVPSGEAPTRVGFELPSWANAAWQTAESDERFDRAMLAFYQGTLLEERFASAALIAYVGCIEGVGGKYATLRRCDCCDACTVNIGAMQAFREALIEAAVPDDMIKFLKKLYGSRSKTAHEGTLHGGEDSGLLGEPPLVFAGVGEASRFRYGAVRIARRAAREVLLHEALGSRPPDLPPIPPLEDQFPRGLIAMATLTGPIVLSDVVAEAGNQDV